MKDEAKSEIRPAATARQRGENKVKEMEISKIEKEELGNFFTACEQIGLSVLLQCRERSQSNTSALVASPWCKVRFGFGCSFAALLLPRHWRAGAWFVRVLSIGLMPVAKASAGGPRVGVNRAVQPT
jgi:hypothetical protein